MYTFTPSQWLTHKLKKIKRKYSCRKTKETLLKISASVFFVHHIFFLNVKRLRNWAFSNTNIANIMYILRLKKVIVLRMASNLRCKKNTFESPTFFSLLFSMVARNYCFLSNVSFPMLSHMYLQKQKKNKICNNSPYLWPFCSL